MMVLMVKDNSISIDELVHASQEVRDVSLNILGADGSTNDAQLKWICYHPSCGL